MSVYEVTGVHDRKEWEGKFGPMVSYVLDLHDVQSDRDHMDVELNRKPESREPQVGEQFVGNLTPGPYGEKLKIDFDASRELNKGGHREASTGTSGGSQSVSKGSSKADVDWDVRNAEIRRQHSQEMAVRVLTAMGSLSQDKEMNAQIAQIQEWAKAWADWFDQDAIEAGQKVNQGAASTTSSPQVSSLPAVSHSDSPPADEHWWLSNLIEQGGASSHASGVLATYALEQLKPEDKKKCEALLSNLDTQEEGRKRLEASYVKAVGPVPSAPVDDPDSSIPF